MRQSDRESRNLRRRNEEPNHAQSPTALGSYDPHKTADIGCKHAYNTASESEYWISSDVLEK